MTRRRRLSGIVVAVAALCVPAQTTSADSAGSRADVLADALSKAGFTPAQSRAIQRDPRRLLSHMKTQVTVRDEALSGVEARAAGYPRRGGHRRTTTVTMKAGITWAWYKVSLYWRWDKSKKRVYADATSVDTDYDITTAGVAAGLRHESDGLTKKGYYTWRGARRGGYIAEGELAVHVCPIIEFSCSPKQTLNALVAGHYDGTVTRKGWSDSE